MTDKLEDFIKQTKLRIDKVLTLHAGSFDSPFSESPSTVYLDRLKQAMEYSLANGGKRVRPVLVYAAAKAISGDKNVNHSDENNLDKIASAVEMIHAYSLIHDDLPAMDDDDLRRGQPTCHKAFDEATAILAGDALQTRALELLTELENCSPEIQLQLVRVLANAAGPRGMVGGQAMDLSAINQNIDMTQLETIHRLKTGALIRAAIMLGATYSGASEKELKALDQFGAAIGLAFQVQDDILDIESDTATLGKKQGADQALNKPTYPSLLGMLGAKEKAQELHQLALKSLEGFDHNADRLREISAFIIARSH